MQDKPTSPTEHQSPTEWIAKIQKWAGLVSTLLGGLGLTAAGVFKWLEDHPHLKLGSYLTAIVLFIASIWLLRSHVKKATKKRQSSLNLDDVIIEPKYHRSATLTITIVATAFTFAGVVWGYHL